MLKRNHIIYGIILFGVILFGNVCAQPLDGENEYRLSAVNPQATTSDTIDSDAGRGIWVADNPDLDGDGKPEIIITDYQKGGRVFVYEVIGNDLLEFVWASPPLSDTLTGGGSTPRSVTTGDFDNNGRQEIVFPVGYFAADSFEFANRGIYFYEFTGTDNDYGSEPAHKITFESIDAGFETVNAGRTENGLRVQDIDGDGKSELIFPPRAFNFGVAKLYILQVASGTFSGGDAVVANEYVYTDMVQPPAISPDGYVPVGTEIGDVDGDGLDEIIVAGWTNIASGAGIGFIQIDGPDQYTPGGIVQLADFSAFVVKGKPLFADVNGSPTIFLHGTNTSTSSSKMWVMDGIVSDAFVSEANITEVFDGNIGFWSAWDWGDQDHPTNSAGDGLDLYIYGGGGTLLDVEYDNTGLVTNPGSYTVKQVYNLSDIYDNVGGLFNDVYTYPGMDLDGDGLRDVVLSYKGSSVDTLKGKSLSNDGFHIYFLEWGDSTQSIQLPPVVGIGPKETTIITPDDYRLAQNYPNPFNPSTTIGFSLPINKTVSLKIYNSLGQEVRALINNQQLALGAHSVQWDGRDNNGNRAASGVYVYTLKFGNFNKSKKMNLIR